MLLKVGWLYKYGRILRLSWWSHYWCVLNQITCCLTCYKSPQNPRRVKDFYLNGKHVVYIGDRVSRVSLPPWLSRDNMLSITSNRKKIIFCCGHRGEAEAWKEILDSFRVEYFPWGSAVTNRIIRNIHKLPEEDLCKTEQEMYGNGKFKRPGELLAFHLKQLGIDDSFDELEDNCLCKKHKDADKTYAEDKQMELYNPMNLQQNSPASACQQYGHLNFYDPEMQSYYENTMYPESYYGYGFNEFSPFYEPMQTSWPMDNGGGGAGPNMISGRNGTSAPVPVDQKYLSDQLVSFKSILDETKDAIVEALKYRKVSKDNIESKNQKRKKERKSYSFTTGSDNCSTCDSVSKTKNSSLRSTDGSNEVCNLAPDTLTTLLNILSLKFGGELQSNEIEDEQN